MKKVRVGGIPETFNKDRGKRAGFSGSSDSKESASNAGDQGSIPESGRSLEKGTATHSSILAWRIPWTEEPGGLRSMWSQRVKHTFTLIMLIMMPLRHGTQQFSAFHIYLLIQPTAK